jgi:uncharacterized membrane protein
MGGNNKPVPTVGVPQRGAVESPAALIVHRELMMGPLPPPDVLAKYNDIIPDGADRLLKLVEHQQEHRIRIEELVIASQQRQSQAGQILAFVIAIVGLAACCYMATHGAVTVAGILATTLIASLVYAFINGRQTQKKDLAKKAAAAPESRA